MMAASTAQRQQASSANALEPGDFPIVIGDSLKDGGVSPRSDLLRLRYNWEPSRGFNDQKGTIKRTNGNVRLAYHDQKTDSPTYEYKSNLSTTKDDDSKKTSTQLVLVFDPNRSAYVLERISHSLDLNLTSAPDQSREDIEQYTHIESISSKRVHETSDDKNTLKANDEEDEADPKNPFDFRNFLSEARENAEKSSLSIGGARTPIPGSRTPISGISSPALPASRLLPNGTPQFRPTPTSAPVIKRSTSSKNPAPVVSKKQNPGKKKVVPAKVTTPQPLSKEVISDSSDEESGNTITVSQSQASKAKVKDQADHDGANSVGGGRSHTVVNDGGLEIDLGSPSPEPQRRGRLDLEAFRSQTHTPVPGASGNRRVPTLSHLDVEMKDASEAEDDVNSFEDRNDDDMDDDVDVETLELPSPQSKKPDLHRDEIERMPLPPTPQPAPAQDEEEDDFTRELEEALAGEDDEAAPAIHVVDEDESEVSEEE